MSDNPEESPQVSAPAAPISTSEVGCVQTSKNGPGVDENLLRILLEAQNKSMMNLISVMRPPVSARKIILPEFDPDKPDTDARAWCVTADLCLSESEQEGSALVIALSGALKGSASQWLSQISFAGMTWLQFKELFLARYGSQETLAATLISMNNSKPKADESLASYAARLSTTLMARFKDMTTEEITLAMVFAHVSQFDGRLQRMAFTTEIKSREQMQRELQACSYLKRKNDNPTSEGTSNFKHLRPAGPQGPPQCYMCGKLGHRRADCRSKDNIRSCDRSASPSANSQIVQRPSTPGITCFRCGNTGHFANKCPRAPTITTGKSAPGDSGGTSSRDNGVASAGSQRRVDLCCIGNPTA